MDRFARLAENERRIREINEEIELVSSGMEPERLARETELEFHCACGRADCTESILLTLDEYEDAHRQPHRFVIVPGHETAAVERVVEKHAAYLVVEKLPAYQAPE